jgi:hypothetical protein
MVDVDRELIRELVREMVAVAVKVDRARADLLRYGAEDVADNHAAIAAKIRGAVRERRCPGRHLGGTS